MKGLNALRPLSSRIVNNILGGNRINSDFKSRNMGQDEIKDKTKGKIGDFITYRDEEGTINRGNIIGVYPGTSHIYEVSQTSGPRAIEFGPRPVRVFNEFIISISR